MALGDLSLEEDEFKPKLRENERIVRRFETEEGWHAILHRDGIGASQLFKTAYKRSLFRNPVLTNQRLILFKDGDIDYEVSLENILEATPSRHLRIGTPYLTLQLNDGATIHLVFESISERLYIGAAVEAAMAWKYAKEWATEIRTQKNSATSATSSAESRKDCRNQVLPGMWAQLPLEAAFCLQCGVKQS